MKRIINIFIGFKDSSLIYKDPGMIVYSLSRYCGWEGTHAFLNETFHNEEFEKYGKLLSMGEANGTDRKSCIAAVKRFIKKEIKNYDVVFLFNYGSTNYKLAYLCKRYNPSVKVYCKLDMGENGFSHFYENGFSRKIKNYLERIKSKYVDLFTVETKYYYDELKDNAMFSGGRLQYLPNGVSCLGVDVADIDKIEKENIILTVGRLGVYEKNNELLLEAISKLDKHILKGWKFYFVGPMTEGFKEYVSSFIMQHKELEHLLIFTGSIIDRRELYSLYAKSKAFCLTSRSEGFNISVLEAMYFGCYPIISNYGCSVSDVTNNGKLGDIFGVGDSEGLAALIESYLITKSTDKNINLSCKEYARKMFDYKEIAYSLDSYLMNLY